MRLVLTSVAVVALLVGCSPGAEESPSPSPEPVETTVSESPVVSPSPSPTTESPSPTPTPTPSVFQSYPADLPTEDPESAAIIEGWQEYQRVYEKFAKDPNGYSDFTETQYVTVDPESVTVLDRIQALREQNLAVVGGSAYRGFEVGAISTTVEGLQTAVLTYCLDLNQFQLRDLTSGEFVQNGGTYRETAVMVEGQDGVWRVADVLSEAAAC